MSLSSAKEGQEVRVVYIHGGVNATKRLAEMGILPGVELKVVSNSIGPILVALGESRIAIGRCLASKVICELKS